MILNIKGIIGSTNLQRKNISNRKKKIEYRSMVSLTTKNLAGRSENRTFDPSKGGIGTRLNTAKIMLIAMT